MDEFLDVLGPVLAEVFVVWADGEGAHLSGPCGPAPWYVEVEEAADPMQVVRRMASSDLGEPLLVHSTSWRRDRTGVVLSFLVVVPPSVVEGLACIDVYRKDLARGEAASAPEGISFAQVLEHALRHLAWLAQDDPVVKATLNDDWKAILSSYVPEPFRHLVTRPA